MATINAVQRAPQYDPIEQIFKGLQVANQIYGIKEAGPRADLLQAQIAKEKGQTDLLAKESQLKDQTAQNQARGIITPQEWVEKSKNVKVVDPSTPGAVQLSVAQPKTEANPEGLASFFVVPKKGDEGIEALIKQQQAAKNSLEIASLQNKSTEIEGPKALAAQFGRRAEKATEVMDQLLAKGYDRTSNSASAEASSGNLPLVGGAFKALQSENTKRQDQAERNFVNAILRRESGAAISKDEFANAEQQYFPRAGDTPEVVAQKRQNMQQVVVALKAEAGPRAWSAIPQVPTPALQVAGSGASTGILAPSQAQAGEGSGQAMPARVKQNGHWYTLNPKTGQYTPEIGQ